MNTTLAFAPAFPIWLLAALGVLAVILAAVQLRLHPRGAVLRLVAMALLLFGLTGPSLVNEDRRPLSSIVALVTDDSPSQHVQNRQADTATAVAALETKLKAIDGVEVRPITVTGAGEDGTTLFSDLSRGLADVPPDRLAGVITVTDGRVHDVPAHPDLSAPFHALITGTPNEIDRRVIIKAAPRFALVGSRQAITFRVENAGAAKEGESVPITVRVDGEEVARRTITADRDVELDVKIGHAGQNFVEVSTDPLKGDLTTLNDRAVAVVEGIRQNLKVLLVSGEPHAGERMWRNLLKSDASVDLVHFTILRPPEKQDGTPVNELSLIPFPTRELFSDKINDFDLIIFDRYQRRGVLPALYFDNIAQYVEKGGAVLIAAGPDDLGPDSIYETPLGPILPVRPGAAAIEQPFFPTVTTLGNRHPVTRDLPGGDTNPPGWAPWIRLFPSTALGGETLMSGDGQPLLVLSHEGKGRVAMLMSDNVWLWARDFAGGGPYLPLLRRLAHWLMAEPDLEEEALRLTAKAGTLTVTRQTLADSVPPVTLTLPDGKTETLQLAPREPGLFSAERPASEPGLYAATDGERRALINLGPPNPKEFSELSSTTEVLKPVAEATGGSVKRLHPGGGSGLDIPAIVPLTSGKSFAGNGWIGLKMTDAYEVRGVVSVHLATGLFALALILGALGLMWWREGR